jgi:hypothetical protein
MSAANCVSVALLGAEVAWRSADVQVNGGERVSAVRESEGVGRAFNWTR